MSLFLISFISIYTAMHVLVWRGVRPLLPVHPLTVPLAFGLAAIMICAPLATRLLERHGWETAARAMAWIGYLWLGFLFLAFCGFLVTGLGEIILALVGRGSAAPPITPVYRVVSAWLVLGLTLGLGLYGIYAATRIRIEHISLTSTRLPPDLNKLKIIQISDLHLGLIHRHSKLARVLELVRAQDPDLLVVTGDLVDAQINHLDGLSEQFATVNPPLGKYAILGNHEFYAGLPAASDFIRRSGFRLLRNESATLRPGLTIVGIDDPAGRRSVSETDLLRPAHRAGFTLFLKHRPDIAPGSLGLFDLQLSGHTHRGQIVPFNLLTALHYPLQNGLYRLAEEAWLYTSRGTGTWGPPMRLGAPPEVTLLVINQGGQTR